MVQLSEMVGVFDKGGMTLFPALDRAKVRIKW